MENWWIWEARNDLIDDVIANGADFTVKLILCFDHAKRGVLAALFDKGEKMIDDVLGRIEYDDDDLMHLTRYRKELAGSPEKFFRVLDKIKGWGKQERAACWGVTDLIKAGRHDLVVPYVDALGERTFHGDILEERAIQRASWEGAKGGNQGIVGLYCEHPAITSEWYALGLEKSWNNGMPNQSFGFYWDKLTKKTWVWPKLDM